MWKLSDLLIELDKIFKQMLEWIEKDDLEINGFTLEVKPDRIDIRFDDLENGEIDSDLPLLEVFESKDYIYLLAEVPGLEEDDIKIKPIDDGIKIETEDGSISEVICLPYKLEASFEHVSIINGVLEVTFKKNGYSNKDPAI